MYDIIIIGSGPAGLSAAIYAQRACLDTIVIEKNGISGGQVLNTWEVDNYPGFPGVTGFELSRQFREHANKLGARVVQDEVVQVELSGNVKKVVCEEETYEARCVILASGAHHRTLEVPGEEELRGAGVSYCATCDGAFFRGRTVAVVGGGDAALEDAIFLARMCEKVYIVHRRDKLRENLLKYDEVMNEQREAIYAERRRVLDGENMRSVIMKMITDIVENAVDMSISDEQEPAEWDLSELNSLLLPVIPLEPIQLTEDQQHMKKNELKHMLKEAATKLYETREAEFTSAEQVREMERVILLKVVDAKWMAHIDDMDQLREGIGLQAYGQRDPLVEYKMSGYEMFDSMTAARLPPSGLRRPADHGHAPKLPARFPLRQSGQCSRCIRCSPPFFEAPPLCQTGFQIPSPAAYWFHLPVTAPPSKTAADRSETPDTVRFSPIPPAGAVRCVHI